MFSDTCRVAERSSTGHVFALLLRDSDCWLIVLLPLEHGSLNSVGQVSGITQPFVELLLLCLSHISLESYSNINRYVNRYMNT